MPRNSKNIFLGFTDICFQLSDFKREYSKLGHVVFLYVNSGEKHHNGEYSFVQNNLYPKVTRNSLLFRKAYTLVVVIPIKFIILLWAAFRYDIFHFMWFLENHNKYYFWFLKLLKKKIIVSFVGSDIRWMPVWITELDLRNLHHAPEKLLMQNTINLKDTLEQKLRYVRICEKYADIIFSGPEQAQLQLRPYYNFYLPVDFDKIVFHVPKSNCPIVSIGITEPNGKNSYEILSMLRKFQENSDIEFKLEVIENISHEAVLEILKESTIFIYSPYVPGPGKFGMEAMAAGALLLTGYDSEWIKYPPNPPLITITPSNMLEKLEYYLMNENERIEIVKNARTYALEYANSNIIARNIIDYLNNPNSIPEYNPIFFREKATFNTVYDSPDSLEVCNKWTNYVKNCGWYQEYIQSGKREGLIF